MVPDPAARAQALDVHGPSRLVDPEAYRWESPGWRGRPWEEAAILEIHVGTFTAEGTFRAAMARLDHVAATGFTAIELMPVAQFAGSRNWGYDGVLLYAPHPAYGTPDDLRALVDAAHARGLMVILDVVYNHFGPEGNYMRVLCARLFPRGADTPWGVAIAYERPEVRAYFIENALYWLDEFRFDGLRLDAADHVQDPNSDRRRSSSSSPRPSAPPSRIGRSISPPRTTATSPGCTSARPTGAYRSTPASGTTNCTTSPT